jgi:hypothetical protein
MFGGHFLEHPFFLIIFGSKIWRRNGTGEEIIGIIVNWFYFLNVLGKLVHSVIIFVTIAWPKKKNICYYWLINIKKLLIQLICHFIISNTVLRFDFIEKREKIKLGKPMNKLELIINWFS